MSFKKRTVFILKVFACCLILYSCNPGDARKIPPRAEDRVRQNIEEGRGFRLGSLGGNKTGEFDFASSNELWRASLDTLEFMPLALANYSGGIIVTDWYSDGSSENESVKISIRFLSNDIRSDALSVKVFYKKCSVQNSCQISDKSGDLSADLSKKILTKASIYKKENKSKKKKKYINSKLDD
tara:strand:+ start:1917 stop:2465 length:549 start_codon:yes stop_codon:yes gene_type:complete